MRSRRGFTLIELLVVIAIIALLMAILMPALQRVKKQAQSVACRSRLKSWAMMYKFYTDDYDGSFNPGWNVGETTLWMNALRPYYKDEFDLLLCPTATRVDEAGLEGTFMAMTRVCATPGGGSWEYIFSYGSNNWTNAMTQARGARLEDEFWKRADVKGAYRIPLIGDSTWHDGWPRATDQPIALPWDFGGGDTGTTGEMNHHCIDRHNGWTNFAFVDWSVRPIGLKQLWTLEWHRGYDENGPYTKAGGMLPSDWPAWLRKYKDY